MTWRRLPLLFLALLAGCAGMGGDRGATSELVGLFRGSFDSALTHDPGDDLNFNPCERDHVDCQAHHAPLADILLEVAPAPGGEFAVQVYRTAADRDGERPLDLLGSGCGTRLGPITDLSRGDGVDGKRWTGKVELTARNRLCLGRLRPTSEHALQLAWYEDRAETPGRSLEVLIDRRVTDANYLYVEEDGVRRRVRIDRDNRLEQNSGTRYRVCIEDDFGEYTRCVMTDRELRQVLLPVPLPSGAAVSYTWWHRLSPRLQSTRGLYQLEQYRGHFTAVED